MEHFSKDVQKLIATCESLAFHYGHALITSEHLLLCILKDIDSPLSKELAKYKLTFDVLEKKLKKKYQKNIKDPLYMEYSPELKTLFNQANAFTRANNEEIVSLKFLLLTLVSENNSLAYLLFEEYKVKINDLKKIIILKYLSKNIELENVPDLHSLYKENKDPLIGRNNELTQLINALSRRNKPNAILVGPPGVGKTAIVEELASLLMQDSVPSLKGKRIFEFDIASAVGGTKYRGEFEEKIKKTLKKVKEAGNIILFVDEIHNIVHAGGAEGAIDASNILKPYLSRGDIQMIGATTEDEFNNVFEKDKPLKRRFQIIKVYPSSKEETLEILKKLKPIYEDFYNTIISDEVLSFIVDYADLYLKEQSFPDKAIDILDNTLVSINHKISKKDVINTFAIYYKIENINSAKFDTLSYILDKEIYGQDEAIKQIKNSLLYTLRKDDNFEGVLLSLLFVGPLGVGKSKTAFIIGEQLYSKDNMFYLNMSQYQDVYALTKLTSNINNEGNGFINKFKNNPHTLLILDEMDKANIEVMDFFMQIIDTGGFYDNNGKYVSMKNVLIIMISSFIYDNDNLFTNNKTEYSLPSIEQKLSLKFRKEFISKIDDIIVFDYLKKDAGEKIAKKYLKSYENIAQEASSIEFDFEDENYYKYGARYIKKEVKKQILEEMKVKK